MGSAVSRKRTAAPRDDTADATTSSGGTARNQAIAARLQGIKGTGMRTLRDAAAEVLEQAVDAGPDDVLRAAVHDYLKQRFAEAPFEFLLAVRGFEVDYDARAPRLDALSFSADQRGTPPPRACRRRRRRASSSSTSRRARTRRSRSLARPGATSNMPWSPTSSPRSTRRRPRRSRARSSKTASCPSSKSTAPGPASNEKPPGRARRAGLLPSHASPRRSSPHSATVGLGTVAGPREWRRGRREGAVVARRRVGASGTPGGCVLLERSCKRCV